MSWNLLVKRNTESSGGKGRKLHDQNRLTSLLPRPKPLITGPLSLIGNGDSGPLSGPASGSRGPLGGGIVSISDQIFCMSVSGRR